MSKNIDRDENSGLKKLVIILAVLVVTFPLIGFGYVYTKLNSIVDEEADKTLLNNTTFKSAPGINNILLVGTDARPGEEVSRSDAMMILTIDNTNKSLKLTSLNRDTYVEIPGRGSEKLTHAYVYGGVNLLIETIENNFELDIQNYAIVNFLSFMDIIDTLGGVEVEVKEREINETNKFIKNETYKWSGSTEPIKLIQSSGVQKLNGYQALSFARIRKNDSTMERDRRQREVIEGVMKGLKELPITKYPELLDDILPYVKTNMNPTKIMSLGGTALSLLNTGINQMEFPIMDGINSESVRLPSAGYVITFTKSSLTILHDFIFNNIIPQD